MIPNRSSMGLSSARSEARDCVVPKFFQVLQGSTSTIPTPTAAFASRQFPPTRCYLSPTQSICHAVRFRPRASWDIASGALDSTLVFWWVLGVSVAPVVDGVSVVVAAAEVIRTDRIDQPSFPDSLSHPKQVKSARCVSHVCSASSSLHSDAALIAGRQLLRSL